MKFSKYNIFSKIKDSENYFIVNLLSGNADILDPVEAEKIAELINANEGQQDSDFVKMLSNKGYFIDENIEKKIYNSKYLDFIDSRDTDEIQFFFVPNYSCNFACSYCYQDEYLPSSLYSEDEKVNFKEVTDAFFRYLQSEFAGRKKYVTLFGGEPLLSSAKQKENISYFLLKANEANLEVCVVTNGYALVEYVDILKQAHIREIQVTLDGTASIHNTRRNLKSGSGTFEKIVDGIDLCIQNDLTINLRMVIDKENVNNLPEFAAFAINKGWTKSNLFKTQLGRNYELHHCQSSPDKLFSRISLYEKLYEVSKKYPHILEFYKPAYSISKFLSENGQLPDPLFDSCPACKTEWALDYTGHIYGCTATVGKSNESLGTFYPDIHVNKNLVKEWEIRDVASINECRNCNLQLACGGGCGSIAKNKTGITCSTDCRPIKELLELGFAAYF